MPVRGLSREPSRSCEDGRSRNLGQEVGREQSVAGQQAEIASDRCKAQMVTAHDPDVHSLLPKPSDDDVALLLQRVWDLLAAGEHWPSYRTVDRQLYRERQIDVDEVIARTPGTLLQG